MNRAVPFVVIVCLSAVAAATVVGLSAPKFALAQASAALMLVALGVGAEMLSYEQVRKGTSGSISLIPFAAAGLCALGRRQGHRDDRTTRTAQAAGVSIESRLESEVGSGQQGDGESPCCLFCPGQPPPSILAAVTPTG